MSFRKLLFWSHLVIGVVAGLVILTMAVTGILIAYQKQIVGAAERSIASISPPATGERMGVEELARKIASGGEHPTALTIRRDPAEPVLVNFGRERAALAHPFTGEALGDASKWRGFLHEVEHVHRDLAMGPNGKLITGAASIAFGVLVLSGLALWWPRKWSRANVAAVTVPSLKLSGKARHFNWHNAFGFWAALPLLVAIVTGMIISYRWASDLVFRLTGNEPPPPRAAAGNRPGAAREGSGEKREEFRADGLAKMWATAMERMPAWQSVIIRFGATPKAPVSFTVDEGLRGRPDQRAQFTFEPQTGELQKWEPYASQNLGRQLRMWVKPLHTGEALGWAGQTIAALAALAACILVWTGFGLALRRFRQRRRGAAAMSSPRPAPRPADEPVADAIALRINQS